MKIALILIAGILIGGIIVAIGAACWVASLLDFSSFFGIPKRKPFWKRQK